MNELSEYKEMREAIARVRELHQEVNGDCNICKNTYSNGNGWIKYPCPTIKALDGEQ